MAEVVVVVVIVVAGSVVLDIDAFVAARVELVEDKVELPGTTELVVFLAVAVRRLVVVEVSELVVVVVVAVVLVIEDVVIMFNPALGIENLELS